MKKIILTAIVLAFTSTAFAKVCNITMVDGPVYQWPKPAPGSSTSKATSGDGTVVAVSCTDGITPVMPTIGVIRKTGNPNQATAGYALDLAKAQSEIALGLINMGHKPVSEKLFVK